MLEGERAEHKSRQHRRRALALHASVAAARPQGAGRGRGRVRRRSRARRRTYACAVATARSAVPRTGGRGSGALWWEGRGEKVVTSAQVRLSGCWATALPRARYSALVALRGPGIQTKVWKMKTADRIEALPSGIISQWKCHVWSFHRVRCCALPFETSRILTTMSENVSSRTL